MGQPAHDRRESDVQMLLLQQKLDDHIVEYKEHCKQQDDRWDRMLTATEENARCTGELAKSQLEYTEATKGILEMWNTGSGVVKFLAGVGRVVKWAAGFAVAGGFFTWMFDKT